MQLSSPLNIQIDEGDGDVLVLLHGFMGCGLDWEDISTSLKSRYRVVAVDLPGHGAAPKAALNWANPQWRVMDELERLIRNFKSERVHLLGYSMGGRIALSFAIHKPHLLTSLILEGTSPGIERESLRQKRQDQEYDWAIKLSTDRDSFLDSWASSALFAMQRERNPVTAERIAQLRAVGDVSGWSQALRYFGLSRQPNFWDWLDGLKVPTLLITGSEDEKFTEMASRMASCIFLSI